MSRFVWGASVVALLAGLYLFLAGSVDGVEITAMVVCASSGTALAVALEAVATRTFIPHAPLQAITRLFLTLLPELLIVGRELLAATAATPQRGAFVQQPFEPGGDDPRSAARRALTIIGASLAPRTIVIRGETTDRLLTHSLPQKPASTNRIWPI